MSVPDPGVLLAVTAVVGAGTAVQVLLGFGVNLLLVPAALLLWPELVPVPAMVVNLLLSAGVAVRWGRHADPLVTRWSLLGAVPGTAVGAALLAVLSPGALGVVGALAVLGAVALTARRVAVPAGPGTSTAAGMASAVLGTTAAVTGPPVALLLAGGPPLRARATVAVSGAVTALVALVVLLAGPLRNSTGDAVAGVAWLLPGLALGWAAGHLLGPRVRAPQLRRMVLVVSAASAVLVLVRSVF